MSKGISERFDEHERDTAPRGYPRPLEDTKKTTKMPAVDVDAMLRTESGTRAVVTPDAIEQHLRGRLDGGFTEDPHARPTIDVGIFPERMTPPAVPDAATTVSRSTGSLRAAPPRSRAWVAFFVFVGVVCFAVAAGSIGFVFGRLSHR